MTRLLALGCKRGQTLRFIAEPETDAVEGLDKVILAVQQGLGEEVEPIKSSDIKVEQSSEIPSHSKPLSTNTGIAASSGLAFGPVHVIKPKVYQYERMGLSVKAEKKNLILHFTQLKTIFTKLLQNLKWLKLSKSSKHIWKCLMTQILLMVFIKRLT